MSDINFIYFSLSKAHLGAVPLWRSPIVISDHPPPLLPTPVQARPPFQVNMGKTNSKPQI